ncbi:hypothetical protein Scep_001030 [Stephania cephalantha]|uniref:Uncharacterized protein n=1 Tax=Stephania cephalantha TaxID=152367 RepID=A0AAP0LBA4_9MAGN
MVELVVEAVVDGVESAGLDPEHGAGDEMLGGDVGDPWHEGVHDYAGEVVGEVVMSRGEAVGEELEMDWVVVGVGWDGEGSSGIGGGGEGGEDSLASDVGGGESDLEAFGGEAFGEAEHWVEVALGGEGHQQDLGRGFIGCHG